jgi:hypothetical protein
VRTRVSVDARTRSKGGRRTRERWQEGTVVDWFPKWYRGTRVETTEETAGKTLERGGRNASFFYLSVSIPITCPRGDGGPREIGKSIYFKEIYQRRRQIAQLMGELCVYVVELRSSFCVLGTGHSLNTSTSFVETEGFPPETV